MSDISVIGLGAMGSALARALVSAGRDVTVWNRSLEKMETLKALGAQAQPDLATAIAASPRAVVCLMDYSSSSTLFGTPEVTAALKGRNIIQLGTSSPAESEASAKSFAKWGAGYIDGTIMCWPGDIGTASGHIAVAGAEPIFADCQRDLEILAGEVRYLGANIRAAATLELAFLSRVLGIIFGSIHGALVCEAEGVPVSEFTAILPDGDRAIPLTKAINDNSFETISAGGASVDVAVGAVEALYQHAKDVGINNELPTLMRGWANRAKAAGYGNQETAAIIKELRQPR
jgi:3-hydroxyisobutyrate dehydrogenase-like beta-hydroxyacid dehydrogenase